MESRFVFSDEIFNKSNIMSSIKKNKKKINEGNVVTILIAGHGRERYKENFKKIIKLNKNYYSESFEYTVNQQETVNTVRILSKAGKPKICAWDYSLCTKNMSSQDVISELSHLFFSEDNQTIDTLSLMDGLSVYFKTIYPAIIEKISRNYNDLPEDKNPGSPGAEGYTERFEEFNKVLDSLHANRFSQLKALSHEKIFTIRPDNEDEYDSCEQYLFEIVEFRTNENNPFIDFILDNLKIRENLVKNYFSMSRKDLNLYIENYKYSIEELYSLNIHDSLKYPLLKFMYNLYFGNEIMLSEIVDFFVILGVDTINIIDNTCRIKDNSGISVYSKTPNTSEIEAEEQIKYKLNSKSVSHGGNRIKNKCKSNITRKNKKLIYIYRNK